MPSEDIHHFNSVYGFNELVINALACDILCDMDSKEIRS